jgi:hypothetical protein
MFAHPHPVLPRRNLCQKPATKIPEEPPLRLVSESSSFALLDCVPTWF